ncbi:unnamed protein product [Larinioides sclopetarius]|uniref:Uncharacterized protein n=1 Tax=Larinioides sclopetarius TaxID=280406 RepID=A0AAV2BZ12_9ARAC
MCFYCLLILYILKLFCLYLPGGRIKKISSSKKRYKFPLTYSSWKIGRMHLSSRSQFCSYSEITLTILKISES